MSAEDKLRQILRSEPVTPAGDGLARIQQRLARRRRLRLVAIPVTALTAAGAILAFFVLGGGAGTQKLVQVPASQGPTTLPTNDASPVTVPGPYTGPALWPFTMAPRSWKSSYPWAGDPRQVAQHFLTDFLSLPEATVATTYLTEDTGWRQGRDYTVQVSGKVVSRVQVQPLAEQGPWTIVSALGEGMRVTTPGVGASIASPTTVSGTLDHAVDDNVRLQLLTTAGREIAATSATAGSAVPWQGTLGWTDGSWSTAGVVATTRSAKDGSLTRLAVVPVTRSTSSHPTFAGLVDGHVALIDSGSGAVVRQLTYPPAGRFDVGVGWNGSSAVWVRGQQTGCQDELDRLDGTQVTTLVKAGSAHLGTPHLSASGNWTAWVQTACAGGDPVIVVRAVDGTQHLHSVPSGQVAQVEDVGVDGSALVKVGTTGSYQEHVVGPTAVSTDDGEILRPDSGCTTTAGAFDGSALLTWQTCGTGTRLLRYPSATAKPSRGPVVPGLEAPHGTTVRSGTVLLWLAGGDTVGEIDLYSSGRLTTVVANAGCSSTSEPKGCVRAPDW